MKSTNQIVFDTSDGTAAGAKHVGVFTLSNVSIKAPQNAGTNAYLKAIKVNGKALEGFDPDTFDYQVALNSADLAKAVQAEGYPGVRVSVVPHAEQKVLYVISQSAGGQQVNVYTLQGR